MNNKNIKRKRGVGYNTNASKLKYKKKVEGHIETFYDTKTGLISRPWEEGPALIDNSDNSYVYMQNGIKHHPTGDIPAQISKDSCYDHHFYYQNGKLHRPEEKGPAKIVFMKDKTVLRSEYYQNDLLHRINGPAVLKANNDLYYYQKGLVHRDDDKPAWIETNNLTQIYYKQGKVFREPSKGPASFKFNIIEFSVIRKGDSMRGRNIFDGPAVIQLDGTRKRTSNYEHPSLGFMTLVYYDKNNHFYNFASVQNELGFVPHKQEDFWLKEENFYGCLSFFEKTKSFLKSSKKF